MYVLTVLVFTLLISAYIYCQMENWKMRQIRKLSQQLKSKYIALPFVGHAYKILLTPSGRMDSLIKFGDEAIENGGMIGAWFGRKFYTVICDAVIADTVLKSCNEKAEFLYVVRDLIGNGSIFAPVHIWRPRRKHILPTFSLKNLRQFLPVFSRESTVLTQRLMHMVGNGSFSIAKYLTSYTMESVCETVLGENLQRNQSEFVSAFKEYCRLATSRMSNPLLQYNAVYRFHPSYHKYNDSKKVLRSFVDEIIESKRASTIRKCDVHKRNDLSQEYPKTFLELFVDEPSENELTNNELREEVLVIAIAGTDTSSVGISFVCTVLSRYPDVQNKLCNEIFSIFGESSRPVTMEDLTKLKYLDAVIKETLRLYPPVPVITRKIDKNFALPTGVTLVENTGVLLSIWSLHRNPRYWGPDADVFNPDRFLNGPPHPGAFMPFSLGPRNCIGYQYAMMSMKTAITALLRTYKLLPPSRAELEKPLSVTFDIMLRDLDGSQLRLERRSY